MALAAGRNTQERTGEILSMPVAANAKIYEGSLVVVDSGYAKPGTTATGLVAAGRAETFADNIGGSDGDVSITVKRGCFKFENDDADTVAQDDVMADCYIVDDETVAATDGESTRSKAGKVIAVDDDGVWVEIK